MLGRRGPAQAAVHDARAQGAHRACRRRPRRRAGRARARGSSGGGTRSDSSPPATSSSCARCAPAPAGKPRPYGSASASRRSRFSATAGRGGRDRAQPARDRRGGAVRAVPTDEREVFDCGLVLRSVGYRGVPFPASPLTSGRDAPNDAGRVLDERRHRAGPVLHRLVQARAERCHRHEQEGRHRDGPAPARGRADGPAPARRGRRPGSSNPSPRARRELRQYAAWEAIDALESGAASRTGRPRMKLSSWDELLEAARGAGERPPVDAAA